MSAEFQNWQEAMIYVFGPSGGWLLVFTLAGGVMLAIFEAARVFFNWLTGLMRGGD